MNAEEGLHSFIGFWRACDFAKAPFVHPEDVSAIGTSFDEYFRPLKSETSPLDMNWFIEAGLGDTNSRHFHSHLLPSPVVGRLATAEILILMTNPGLAMSDHHSECLGNFPEFAEALKNTLYQREFDAEYPFMFLNPAFAFHGGFTYWQEKFCAVVKKALGEETLPGKELFAAFRKIAQKVACLELIPYHSRKPDFRRQILNLPSVTHARSLVFSKLKDPMDKTTIVVMRADKQWFGVGGHRLEDIPPAGRKRIVNLAARNARSAHLTDNELVKIVRTRILDSNPSPARL